MSVPDPNPDVCDRCETPVSDFEHGHVAEFGEESVCIACRKDELRNRTVLSDREAHVQAAKEITDGTHREIADILRVEKPTVDEYSRRINEKIEKAQATVALFLPDDD